MPVIRNATLYNNDDNLVDIANKTKDYLFTISMQIQHNTKPFKNKIQKR